MYNIIKTVTISMIQKKNTVHDVICTQQIYFFFKKKGRSCRQDHICLIVIQSTKPILFGTEAEMFLDLASVVLYLWRLMSQRISCSSRFSKIYCCSRKCGTVAYIHVQSSMLHYRGAPQNLRHICFPLKKHVENK